MPLSNFGIVAPYRLYRCGQPDEQGFNDLRTLGVMRVLKLNSEHEYPIDRERNEFPVVEGTPLSTFFPNAGEVRRIVALLQMYRRQDEVTAVHCTHGRDRTGLVIGAWRLIVDRWVLDHVNEERAVYGVASIVKLADHAINECLEQIATEEGL